MGWIPGALGLRVRDMSLWYSALGSAVSKPKASDSPPFWFDQLEDAERWTILPAAPARRES